MARRVKTTKAKRRKVATKRKQKAFLKKAGIFGFLAAAAVFGGIYLVYFSPYFQIQKIEVRNAKMVSSEDLQKALAEKYPFSFSLFGHQIGSNSIMLPFFNSAALLDKFPQIEKLSLSRDFPNVLTLDVKEREPFALWCKDWDQKMECSWSDKKGICFRDYGQEEQDFGNFLVIEEKESFQAMAIETRMDKEGFLEWSAGLKKYLDEASGTGGIEKFSIYADRLVLKTGAGFEIYMDTRGDLDWQEKKLKTVLGEKVSDGKLQVSEYIDLRFGNQAVVK